MKTEYADRILKNTIENYNAIAEAFSESRNRVWKDLLYCTQYVKDGQYVLDLGCGNGRLLNALNNKDIQYVGVDPSEGLIEIARKKRGDQSAALFYVGDAMNLSFLEQRFDTVFLVAVLHHIPSIEYRKRVLTNIFEKMNPGGTLVMTNWNIRQKNLIPFVIKAQAMRLLGSQVEVDGIPYLELDADDAYIPWKKGIRVHRYVHGFKLKEVAELVESVGFNITENFYAKEGERSNWWKAANIITIAKKK